MIPHAKGCQPSCMSDADGSRPNPPQAFLDPLAGGSKLQVLTASSSWKPGLMARQGLEQMQGNFLEFMLDINDGRPRSRHTRTADRLPLAPHQRHTGA